MTDTDVETVKKELTKKKEYEPPIKKEDFLSSGSTLLNLAVSGNPYGAFVKGKYFWFVGDSDSGKTFLTMTALAEATINKNFEDYDLIFDNAEDGALMNVEKFFGHRLVKRLQSPRIIDGLPVYSRKIEQLYYHLDDRLESIEKGKGKPFIYLMDSIDSLSSESEEVKFGEMKKADRKGKEISGIMTDGKAKINSMFMRGIVSRLSQSKSILIVISQTRDNMGGGKFDPKSVSAGGRALKFYAACQIWSSPAGKLVKTVNTKPRQIGINAKIAVKKNRITGKEWSVELPIYWSSGLDNLGSMVDFLVEEKHWSGTKDGKTIEAEDLDFEGSRDKLIAYIEENNLEMAVTELVVEVWKEIEEACSVQRKSRYS